jgi:hypothetical protein
VGFALPSAGVTPAPNVREDAGLRPCWKGLVEEIFALVLVPSLHVGRGLG